jgi:hypothetical protein
MFHYLTDQENIIRKVIQGCNCTPLGFLLFLYVIIDSWEEIFESVFFSKENQSILVEL